MPIEFTVFGKSETAGSKKGFPFQKKNGGLGVSLVDANPRTKDWQKLVAVEARKAHWGPLLDGPLAVQFTFYKPRPKSHFGTGRNAGVLKGSAPPHPGTRPDVLKLARAIEDALTGVVWRDDAQIVDEHLHKRYGEPARVEISIAKMNAEVQGELFE